jgi:hypothetical protein
MQQFGKGCLYIFGLVAVGMLFQYLQQPTSRLTIDMLPKAEAEARFLPQPLSTSRALMPVESRTTPQNEATPSADSSVAAVSVDAETGLAPGQGQWSHPEGDVRIEDRPALDQSVRLLESMNEMEFTPIEEPVYVGKNDDGFDQFEYHTASGEKVMQWNYGSELSVERIEFADGSTLIRRPNERDGLKAEVDYAMADGTFQRVIYDGPGHVEALHSGTSNYEYLHRFDSNGRLIETYRGRRPQDANAP